MPEKRADTLLQTMQVIEHFTLQRASHSLSDEELFFEPIAGSWVFAGAPNARPRRLSVLATGWSTSTPTW